MSRSPVHIRQSRSPLGMATVMTHRFAACAVLTLLASLPHSANAAQYGNDPLGQVYTHDGGGYVYDANQNQTFQYVKAPDSATPTVAYAAFPGLEIEYRLDASGNLTRQALRRHIGSERKTVIGPSDDAMVESDVLGNVAMVRHSRSGLNTAYANYTPFGQMIQSRSSGFSNEWYGYKSGRIDLTGTGLYRFGDRSYDPTTTRWTSRDPIRDQLAASDAYAAFNENAIVNDDPSGLQSVPGAAGEKPNAAASAAEKAAALQREAVRRAEYIRLTGDRTLNNTALYGYFMRTGRTDFTPALATAQGSLTPGTQTSPANATGAATLIPGRGSAILPFPINLDFHLTIRPFENRPDRLYFNDLVENTGLPSHVFLTPYTGHHQSPVLPEGFRDWSHFLRAGVQSVSNGELHPLARVVHGLLLQTHGIGDPAVVSTLARALVNDGGLQAGIPIVWTGCNTEERGPDGMSDAQQLANELPNNPLWAEKTDPTATPNPGNGVMRTGLASGAIVHDSDFPFLGLVPMWSIWSNVNQSGYPTYQLGHTRFWVYGGALQLITPQPHSH